MPRYRHEEVYDDLRSRIGPGKEFPPGARLPSRAGLREYYKISDFVADKVMWRLRHEGLTETLSGVAVYVRDPVPGQENHPD